MSRDPQSTGPRDCFSDSLTMYDSEGGGIECGASLGRFLVIILGNDIAVGPEKFFNANFAKKNVFHENFQPLLSGKNQEMCFNRLIYNTLNAVSG